MRKTDFNYSAWEVLEYHSPTPAGKLSTASRKTMNITVLNDDQQGRSFWGTGLLNALEIAGKKIGRTEGCCSRVGASAMSCAPHYIKLGVCRENIVMYDNKGVI